MRGEGRGGGMKKRGREDERGGEGRGREEG